MNKPMGGADAQGQHMMKPADLQKIRTVPLGERTNKFDHRAFALPARPGRSFAEFLAGLPHVMAANDLHSLVEAIVSARKNGRPVIFAVGGHVVKCGLNPVLIGLWEQGIITHLAMNGSAAIHDFELALIGETSEDVAAGLKDGTFGMVRETAELMNQGINRVMNEPERGMGELLAAVIEETDAPFKKYSLLSAGRRLGAAATVHVAVGTDIIHMHPSANGAAIGLASFNDFRRLAGTVLHLSGGVHVNLGSAVVMPEVFLKAFTIAQNLGADLHDFVTANLDMQPHYRPSENVVRRPPLVGGRGYSLIGRHEIMVPLLAQALAEAFA